MSYERSLSTEKKVIVEADSIDDVNDLCSELLESDDYSEGMSFEQCESDEIAETDYIEKLSLLLNKKKFQTKYVALNINDKLTTEQRHVLERVFDIISQDYGKKTAEKFINTIMSKF